MKFARYDWTVIGDHENAGCMGNILAYPGDRGKIKMTYQLPHNNRMQTDRQTATPFVDR